MAPSQSTPTIKDLSEKINGISIRSGGGSSGKSWSSPSSDLIVRRSQQTDQYHSRTQSNGSNGSVKSLEGKESAGSMIRKKANFIEGAPLSLSGEQSEAIRFSMVRRKKNFKCMERVNGRLVNVLEGLELHTGVFSPTEQQRIVDCVYDLQEKGRKRELRERTYSEPKKWMRGKGRVTMQFGCCYNYATDKHGNPPGIIRDEEVDPIPPLLKLMIKRMVAWHVLPPTCIPNSCIINIYEKDDCIPPHIDHHDFVRPFCTVSFLTECNILFGSELKVLGPGDFSGSTAIPLPVGSVLILSGNGADVAKHCVPAVPSKRISITFRKMDDSKLPLRFTPDPELQNLRPLAPPLNLSPVQQRDNRVLGPPQQQSQHWTSPSQAQQGSSHFPVPPVQQQSQHWTSPSQVSSHWRSQNSGDQKTSRDSCNPRVENSKDQSLSEKNQLAASGKNLVQFSQDDFPSLGSSAFSKPMRKPSKSLRQ